MLVCSFGRVFVCVFFCVRLCLRFRAACLGSAERHFSCLFPRPLSSALSPKKAPLGPPSPVASQVILSGDPRHGSSQVSQVNSHVGSPNDKGGLQLLADVDGEAAVLKAGNRYLGLRLYLDYLQFLFRKLPRLSEDERMEREYKDYLQNPLQPLRDNLEFTTYETFERDRTKYEQYEEAIRKALEHLRQGMGEHVFTEVVVMVVGSGRGPIVDAVINA